MHARSRLCDRYNMLFCSVAIFYSKHKNSYFKARHYGNSLKKYARSSKCKNAKNKNNWPQKCFLRCGLKAFTTEPEDASSILFLVLLLLLSVTIASFFWSFPSGPLPRFPTDSRHLSKKHVSILARKMPLWIEIVREICALEEHRVGVAFVCSRFDDTTGRSHSRGALKMRTVIL